jgi:predicted AAA+ superfamily ATPase
MPKAGVRCLCRRTRETVKINHLVVDFQPPGGYYPTMIPRLMAPKILAALADTPVVFLAGARQTGKSTLARWIADGPHPAQYLTFDDATVLAAATADPAGFLAGFTGPVVLDEVQRVPALLMALKAQVDRDRTPGRYLLTGSANVLLLPRLAQELVGRMEVLTLWPFAQVELESGEEGASAPCPNLVDELFAPTLPPRPPASTQIRTEALRRALLGGYPEALTRSSAARRRAWWGSYVTTLLQRDIRDLARIEGLSDLPQLLSLVAARSTGLLNYAELSRSSGLPQTTLKRYLALFEATYLIQTLPAWSGNLSKRLVKSPKLLLSDTGLLAYLLGFGEAELPPTDPHVGPLMENLVGMELRKLASWSQVQPELYHFRTHAQQEVDLVLEDGCGRLVGVEVKAAETVRASDLAGLRFLAEQRGERFVRGVVLYGGSQSVPFGENLQALPLSMLWGA